MLTLIVVNAAPSFAAYGAEDGVRYLVPVGHSVGIKLFADGVVVVETTEVETDTGAVAPAMDAGLQAGDVLVSINGNELDTAQDLVNAVKDSETGEIQVIFERNGVRRTANLTAACDVQGNFRMGVMVRDSIAGIGTMTYYDPETGKYGALGHGINDVDTGILMPMETGSIMDAAVVSVKRSEVGMPGELHGSFDMTGDIGSLELNTEKGVFGSLYNTTDITGEALPVAQSNEIETGDAFIYTNVSGDEVEKYEIRIVRKNLSNKDGRDMLIEVTDPALIEITGGIVQGMSGSPIIQNGKIIGAVTHVLVDRPTIGYGIFIENMLNAAE